MIDARENYLTAANSAIALLCDPAVADAWNRPSALAKMDVSVLAGHLAAQILQVPGILAEALTDQPPTTLDEYYRGVAWIDAGVDHEIHVGIRGRAAEIAADGPAPLADRAQVIVDELAPVIRAEPADRLVMLAKGPCVLALDDLLVMRTMELVVHSDDLAVSVGVPTPRLPDEVVRPVIDLLTPIALRRHGATALVRALTRRERAPETIAAF